MADKIDQVKQFVVQNFLFGDGGALDENTSFMDAGIIDSTGILELITHLENTYQIKIQDDELVPENLDSLVNIQCFLDRKLACVE